MTASDKCIHQHAQGCTITAEKCPCRYYSEDTKLEEFKHEHWCFNLIRCKDCKHWAAVHDSNGDWINWCKLNGSGWTAMSFCSKGEENGTGKSSRTLQGK